MKRHLVTPASIRVHQERRRKQADSSETAPSVRGLSREEVAAVVTSKDSGYKIPEKLKPKVAKK